MIEKKLIVSNQLGLHARATAKLVQMLAPAQSACTLIAKGREVNAKSIMGVMLLAAGLGTEVIFRADGPDELDVANAVEDLFNRKFDEDN